MKCCAGYLGHLLVEIGYQIRKPPHAMKMNWLQVSACHADLLGDNRTPVGSGRFRDLPKTTLGSWAGLAPLALLSGKRARWHTLTGQQAGQEVTLLAQPRLPLQPPSKSLLADKSILFPAPQSLSCSSI
jgi:hypothetical protein